MTSPMPYTTLINNMLTYIDIVYAIWQSQSFRKWINTSHVARHGKCHRRHRHACVRFFGLGKMFCLTYGILLRFGPVSVQILGVELTKVWLHNKKNILSTFVAALGVFTKDTLINVYLPQIKLPKEQFNKLLHHLHRNVPIFHLGHYDVNEKKVY